MIFVIYKEKINTMKKSRIIIPALALIAFSVAASVTGAVAWFTASRTASISAGTYAVVKTSSNLECHTYSGAGTTADDDKDIITVGGVLTDGSFDHENKIIYAPNEKGDGLLPVGNAKRAVALTTTSEQTTTWNTPASYVANLNRGSTTVTVDQSSVTKTIYTAVTFDISFTINFGAVSGDIGLYLDNTLANDPDDTSNSPAQIGKSHFKVSDGSAALTAKGFRMAFVGHEAASGSTANTRVFADLQDEKVSSGTPAVETTVVKYIGGSNPDSAFTQKGLAYGNDVVIDKNYEAALPTSTSTRSEAINRKDCFGVFGFQASTRVTLTYTVVAWFEGTDPEIVNRDLASEYQSVIARLNFEAIDLPAA